MQSLPAELKRHIVLKLSSGSPSSLAALARTHTAYQREAEKALYDTLYISASSDDSLICMKTLATNSEKAALVRFLTIEFDSDNTINPRMLTYVSKGLINMHCLSDFRVRSCPDPGVKLMKVLDKTLRSVCNILISSKLTILLATHSRSRRPYRLKALYCPRVTDITRIIEGNQTELQILGLYTPVYLRNTLKVLKKFHNTQIFIPIVLHLEREGSIPFPIHMSIFPAFYSVDRRATMHQVLAQSVCKDQGDYTLARGNNIFTLAIYLNDSSDIPSIHALAKDMAVTFPNIYELKLCFERRCEIVSFLLTVDETTTAPDLKGISIILATTGD